MSRKTPFQPSHALEYGLSVIGVDLQKAVSCVQCNFCVYFGRSGDNEGRKRARTENTRLYTPPYRPEAYRTHLRSQHAEPWLTYQALSKADKKTFFDIKNEGSLNAFICTAEDTIQITIASNIVNDLIGTLFFHPVFQ